MNNTYKLDYKVKYSEVDSNYLMRLDHIVTHFQDITGLHSNEMEIDFPEFEETVEIETWSNSSYIDAVPNETLGFFGARQP